VDLAVLEFLIQSSLNNFICKIYRWFILGGLNFKIIISDYYSVAQSKNSSSTVIVDVFCDRSESLQYYISSNLFIILFRRLSFINMRILRRFIESPYKLTL